MTKTTLQKDIKEKEEEIEKLKEKLEQNPLLRIKAKVLKHLLQHKNGEDKQGRMKATEAIVEYITNKTQIYTTRDDEKPELWVYHEGIYNPNAKTYISQECRKILESAYTTQFANQIIEKIKTDTYIDPKDFFTNENIGEIAVQNGILDIRTRKLTEFTPKKIFFNKLPVTYNPNAKCPKIIEHIKTVTKYKEDHKLLQELFGYLLLKENKYEKAFMFVGDGRNGKTKTLELMKRFIGPDNCINKSLYDLENDQWAKGELFGKMANLAGEIGKEVIYKEQAIKEISGRDFITPPRKFKSSIGFENYAKIIFAANELPDAPGKSFGWWSRWVMLEFPYKFVTQDIIDNATEKEKEILKLKNPDIIKEITTEKEMNGLLIWALDGLERLEKNKDFSKCETVEEIQGKWKRKSNSLISFLEDCCIIKENTMEKKTDLKKHYYDYCKKLKLKRINEKRLKATMEEEIGLVEIRETIPGEGRIRFWDGVQYVGFLSQCDQVDQPDQGKPTLYEKTIKPPIGVKHPGHPGQSGQDFNLSTKTSLGVGQNNLKVDEIYFKAPKNKTKTILNILRTLLVEKDSFSWDEMWNATKEQGFDYDDVSRAFIELTKKGVLIKEKPNVYWLKEGEK